MCWGCGRTKDEICEYNSVMFQQHGTFSTRTSYIANPNASYNSPRDFYR